MRIKPIRPAFDTHISHGRKPFFSSFELKVSIQVVFITIVIEFFAGHLIFQSLRFFLQYLVSHISLVSSWQMHTYKVGILPDYKG